MIVYVIGPGIEPIKKPVLHGSYVIKQDKSPLLGKKGEQRPTNHSFIHFIHQELVLRLSKFGLNTPSSIDLKQLPCINRILSIPFIRSYVALPLILLDF